MDCAALYVSVPVASFRAPYAREYFETLPCPPPSTVYGMLLSLVGEPDRLRHIGAEIAIGLLSAPETSVVLRTLWRVKSKEDPPGTGENKRPDFQELLTNVRLAVWVRPGRSERRPTLHQRVMRAVKDPVAVARFGGLSLGESTHLVDEIRPLLSSDTAAVRLLLARDDGDISLSVWADHVGSAGTKWKQFKIGEKAPLGGPPPDNEWVAIERLNTAPAE